MQELDSLEVSPIQAQQPLWMKKFNLWASMQKACSAARGPNGIYCSWEGKNCGYSGCPRRIFEEEAINPDNVVPSPQPKLRTQILALQTQNKLQQEQIEELIKKVEELTTRLS